MNKLTMTLYAAVMKEKDGSEFFSSIRPTSEWVQITQDKVRALSPDLSEECPLLRIVMVEVKEIQCTHCSYPATGTGPLDEPICHKCSEADYQELLDNA